MEKDIYTYLKDMVRCTYESDLKDHKKEVLIYLTNLQSYQYSKKEVEDVVNYVFGSEYLKNKKIRSILKRFN